LQRLPPLQSPSFLHSTQILFTHFSLVSQSPFFVHFLTHRLFTQLWPALQFLSDAHSTQVRLSQTSFCRQSLRRLQLRADALSTRVESPIRPSALPAAALSTPRRRDGVPKMRVISSNR
jgi:hypothetical protein